MNERVALHTHLVSNSAASTGTYACSSNTLLSIIFDYALSVREREREREMERERDFHDNYATKQKRKGGKQPSGITVIAIMWGTVSA